MSKFALSETMKIASIWVVWIILAVGGIGWSVFVLFEHFGVLDKPAWVQAIGSIVAIFVAVSVAYYSQEKMLQWRAEDANAISHAHAVRLYLLIWEADSAVGQLVKRCNGVLYQDEFYKILQESGAEGVP